MSSSQPPPPPPQRPGGIIVGQRGVKYGLQTRQPAGAGRPTQQPRQQQQQLQQPAGRLAAFGGDSDSDEETVGAQVARQAARKVTDAKVQDMYAAALAEDPAAFDYDGVYDRLQADKAAPALRDKAARQPRYIAGLLEQAEVRRREQDIAQERRLVREREREDRLYGEDGGERFVTAAYRAKLEEDRKWQEAQRARELEQERGDVRQAGMGGFYAGLARNVALGGAAGASAAAAAPPPAAAAAAPATAAAAAAEAPAKEEPAGAAGPRRRSSDGSDGARRRQQPEQGRRSRTRSRSPGDEGQQPERRSRSAEQQQQQQLQRPPEPPQQPGGGSDAAAAAATSAGKRKNDDASVAAARERYLARKRLASGAG